MRDYTDEELEVVQKSFGGRYALRDRCYFEMALQMGLRVSEMLSIRVGQVYQYGRVVDEVSIDRKHIKGGKAGKASGRTLPIFAATKPHILAWRQVLAGMLKLQDITDIPSETPLFMSRVRNPDGSRRAIARETAWRIIKAIAHEKELPGAVGTHSTRKTLARKAMAWANDTRGAKALGPQELAIDGSLFEVAHRPRSLERLPDGDRRGVEDEPHLTINF